MIKKRLKKNKNNRSTTFTSYDIANDAFNALETENAIDQFYKIIQNSGSIYSLDLETFGDTDITDNELKKFIRNI